MVRNQEVPSDKKIKKKISYITPVFVCPHIASMFSISFLLIELHLRFLTRISNAIKISFYRCLYIFWILGVENWVFILLFYTIAATCDFLWYLKYLSKTVKFNRNYIWFLGKSNQSDLNNVPHVLVGSVKARFTGVDLGEGRLQCTLPTDQNLLNGWNFSENVNYRWSK